MIEDKHGPEMIDDKHGPNCHRPAHNLGYDGSASQPIGLYR
jgi:hypothetical protein